MQYVGIHTQMARNNWNSIMLLLMFPCIILGMLWVFCCVFGFQHTYTYDQYYNNYNDQYSLNTEAVNGLWLEMAPWAIVIVGIWFTIAYLFNAQMVQYATGAKPLERKENPRIYNMVENLCMSCGMPMRKVNIIEDPQLNAFASGINPKSYTGTLTRGIIDYLDDDELEGVIAHELTHIRNRDTKVLIISIVFVGILSTLLTLLTRGVLRMFLWGNIGSSRRSNNKGNGGVIVVIIVAIICAAIAYFLTLLTRFAISRKREFMADAGSAELTRNPRALASALRKIASAPGLGHVEREDIAQLYIIHPKKYTQSFFDKLQSLFSTHPSTEERIRILEQF